MNDYPYELGTHRRTISTTSADAQIWFDRGLNWCFGYNHEEAAQCFKKALESDPDCAMAHWGVAYVMGPNYNKPWELFDANDLAATLRVTREAIAAAQASSNTNATERALIAAIDKRYQSDAAIDDLYIWSLDYANAMREVYDKFPNDYDVVTLFVEAMMNRTPWQMWDPRSGEPVAGADTLECREVLEKSIAQLNLAGATRHPGVLHLYVHLMEMSPFPEKALRTADDLRDLVPDAGHLNHMATHIDVLCGNYQAVVASNSVAILADYKYFERNGAMNFYSLYRAHNYHFKLYGAMFLGQYAPAIDAVEAMMKTLPDELMRLESPPMANWLEGYASMKTHAYVRFGRWQELLDQALPDDQSLYCMSSAMNYYGKGVAHSVLGNVDAALAAQKQFEAAANRVPRERHIHVVSCEAILGVAREMLAGELEYRRENYSTAFAHLRQAVINEDQLPYDEPWGWMQPSRHALGALLLEQNHVEEAAAAYRADLGVDDTVLRSNQHPDNVWALMGLHECYTRLGKSDEAQMIKPRLNFALARADLPIKASCFCSLNAAD
ncbi:MAG: tetratricopeptide (TPR) repeat protein [Gammaproteobacteria bacterium]|jgi:tetratricopeptide (TPR) repeat protein